MSPRVGNISFPVMKPTEPSKKFYSDKLARLMDEVGSYFMFFMFPPGNTWLLYPFNLVKGAGSEALESINLVTVGLKISAGQRTSQANENICPENLRFAGHFDRTQSHK